MRSAQAAMRHSKPDLTANVYTDPRLLDVDGALNALLTLLLDNGNECEAATGTDDASAGPPRKFAPKFAPTPDNLV